MMSSTITDSGEGIYRFYRFYRFYRPRLGGLALVGVVDWLACRRLWSTTHEGEVKGSGLHPGC
jgi:hypothetical protein